MRTLLVSGANEAFMPLLRGLLGSIARFEPIGDLAVLDLGLTAASRDWLARQVRHIVEPGWDLPVDPGLRAREPHLRALTARPFLRDHFPGYDKYLWIDADTWVQARSALEWYAAVATHDRLAITPQVDRAYRHDDNMLRWRFGRMQTCHGEAAAQRLLWDTYFNAGVFCLESAAPHWQQWAAHFRAGLTACSGTVCSDQTALNHAIWSEGLAVHPLPALCNWLCHLAVPYVDPVSGQLSEPLAPRNAIGIVHLSATSKELTLERPGPQGVRMLSLRSPYG